MSPLVHPALSSTYKLLKKITLRWHSSVDRLIILVTVVLRTNFPSTSRGWSRHDWPLPLLFYSLRSAGQRAAKGLARPCMLQRARLSICLPPCLSVCLSGGGGGGSLWAPAQTPGAVCQTLHPPDMLSEWLGQTCASPIRLFTRLLFLCLSFPPQSLILGNVTRGHASRKIHNERCTMAETAVCVLSFSSFFFFVVITMKIKVKLHYERMLSCGYFFIWIPCGSYFFSAMFKDLFKACCTMLLQLLCVFFFLPRSLRCATDSRRKTWLSCCIKAEHRWSRTLLPPPPQW